jgi:WD40 repeat protein
MKILLISVLLLSSACNVSSNSSMRPQQAGVRETSETLSQKNANAPWSGIVLNQDSLIKVEFTADSRKLLEVSTTGFTVISLPSQKVLMDFSSRPGHIYSASISPDGNYVAWVEGCILRFDQDCSVQKFKFNLSKIGTAAQPLMNVGGADRLVGFTKDSKYVSVIRRQDDNPSIEFIRISDQSVFSPDLSNSVLGSARGIQAQLARDSKSAVILVGYGSSLYGSDGLMMVDFSTGKTSTFVDPAGQLGCYRFPETNNEVLTPSTNVDPNHLFMKVFLQNDGISCTYGNGKFGSFAFIDVANNRVNYVLKSPIPSAQPANFSFARLAAVSPDLHFSILGGGAGLRIFDNISGQKISSQDGWEGSAQFSPDSNLVAAIVLRGGCASNFNSCRVQVLDITSGKMVYDNIVEPYGIQYLTFSPDGTMLATVSISGKSRITFLAP